MANAKADYVSGEKILKEDINNTALHTTPTGGMLLWPVDAVPTGWLLCDGSAISRTTFADLFALIGTQYGVGDGSTTFNIPKWNGRIPLGKDDMGGTPADVVTDPNADVLGGEVGSEEHTLTIAEMPTHSHTYENNQGGGSSSRGIQNANFAQNVSTGDAGGGGAHNNLQPSLTVNFIIKT